MSDSFSWLFACLRRAVRPGIWAALILALYAVAGFLGAPLAARHYVKEKLPGLLGREVAVDDIGFNPFTLTVDVRGVRLLEKDGVTAALGFAALRANLEIESLWRGGPVIHEIRLDDPMFSLVREGDGRYNWSDLIERFGGVDAGTETGAARRPFVFSFANIQVSGGRIDVDDRMTGLRHRLDQIEIGLPFISNLAVEVDVFVEPALSAMLNGKALEMNAEIKPFAATREARFDCSLESFDLAPWLAYLPFEPAFSISSGTLDLDLSLTFSQAGDKMPAIRLQGAAQIDRLAVHDRDGEPVLTVMEAGVELDVEPLAGRYRFNKARLLRPELDLVRLADGRFNVLGLLPAMEAGRSSGKLPSEEKKGSGIDFLLASGRVRDGVIRYVDRAVKGGFELQVGSFNLDLRDLGTETALPAELQFDYLVAGGEKFSHQDKLRLVPFEYEGSLAVQSLEPGRYAPYYAASFGGKIHRGKIDGILRYRIAAAPDDGDGKEALAIEFGADSLILTDFAFGLAGRGGELLKLARLVVSGARVRPEAREVEIAELGVEGATLALIRSSNGRFDAGALFGKADAGDGMAWKARIARFVAGNGALRFEDRTVAPAVLSVDRIELRVDGFSTEKSARAEVDFAGRVNAQGKVGVRGTIAAAPFDAALKVDVNAMGLAALRPWVREWAMVDIRDGKLDWQGELKLRSRGGGVSGAISGNASLRDFVSFDRINGGDFMRWKEIALRKGRLVFAPATPPRLDIDDIVIDGLQTRLILDQAGRLNLRELHLAPERDAGREDAPPGPETANVEQTAVVRPEVRIGRIGLKGGAVAFSDRFVRPNYDVRISGLTGELTGLSSKPDTLSKLNLRGRVERTAPVTIQGEFNPWRDDGRFGIEATVKDFELTGLSGYAGRYVGYGIQRGKLSATLDYRIEDRKLIARNHLFLDQLTFGDQVDSAEKLDLPVRLAVSLLQNSRGEISIDLPVSGTLDDPEFSVGGLVFRAFAGLIGKALTAPFALLGREELSSLDFEPGQAVLNETQIGVLREIASTLVGRPALKLDLTGLVSREFDAEGIRRFKLLNQIRAAKRHGLDGEESAKPPLWAIELSGEEYARFLGEIYDEAEIEAKPRNFLGFAKELPVIEMEALLLPHIEIDDADLVTLARRREAAVRHWLIDEGKVDGERIFQRALTVSEIDAGEREGHGVRFSLH
jgi:uncharacterized protein involved in outer membrane biogenesis